MFDIVVYSVLFIFALIAFLRGFIKEFIGFFGHVLSIYLSYQFSDDMRKFIATNFESIGPFASALSSFLIYLLTMIGFWLINSLFCSLLLPIRLGFLDRFFGIVLGICKGFALCFGLYIGIIITYPIIYDDPGKGGNKYPDWLTTAKTYGVFGTTEKYLDKYFDININDMIQKLSSSSKSPSGKDKDKSSKPKSNDKSNKKSESHTDNPKADTRTMERKILDSVTVGDISDILSKSNNSPKEP